MTQPFDNRDWDVRQIQEKDAEIGAMGKLAVLLKRDIAGKDAEIAGFKVLLRRAADALEFWMKDLASTEQQYVDAAMRDERLLAELRKAAECKT